MPRKPAASYGRKRRTEDETGNGIVARVIDRTFENPAMTGGLIVMAITATAIVSNALLLQGTRHPHPIFSTSSPGDGQAAVPVVHVRSTPMADNPPMPHLAPRPAVARIELPAEDPVADLAVQMPAIEPAPPSAPEVAAESTVPDPAAERVALVTEVQRELARIGLYNGPIDGLPGPRTEAAIKAFEGAAGIAVTGAPSAELLAALNQPLPPRSTTPTVAAEISAEADELNRRERERAESIAAEQRRQAELRLVDTYKAVQTALNRIGYGPLAVDGAPNAQTLDAIRRFELDNGMPITGQANDALIARLVAIGAIKPG